MKARKAPVPTPPEDGGQKALFRLPDEIRDLHAAYQSNKPTVADPEAVFHEKQRRQDQALGEILAITASLIEKKGAVTQPALVTRRLDPLFDTLRMEVRLLDRCDAEFGRPLFVVADNGLKDKLRIGDVVVLSREGSSIVDIDNKLGRSGQNATVIGINPAHDFRYELELEGDNHLSRRMDAIAWERLEALPAVGDRVKVMGGVIHSYAPRESASRFKKPWRDDLDITDLCGTVPRRTCSLILSRVHRWFNGERYPKRSRRFSKSDTLLLYGPAGVGKTWTVTVAWSITQRLYNNGKEQVTFLVTEGSAVEGALVGSGPAALRELRSLAKQALSQGKLPMTFINEGGSLLRSREVQGMMLDGGSSLSTHEQFLAMLSGPDEIPGIVIVDLNMEKNLDEATRQRFQCVSYPHIDQATLVDQMFRSAFDKERDLFEGPWDEIRAALMSALATPIGSVLVGSDQVAVRVGNLASGRLYENVIRESLNLVDLSIFTAAEQGLEPLYVRIGAPLLYYTLTQRAWSLFKCWDDNQARERLVPEVVRPDKARSISKPTALPWHEIEMPEQYDCRGAFDELLSSSESPDSMLG